MTTATLSVPAADGSVTLTFNSFSATCIPTIWYRLGTGPDTLLGANPGSLRISKLGTTEIHYWAVDLSGNVEAAKVMDVVVLPPLAARLHPWSKVASGTTGDYFVDRYSGVGTGHVFENATTDRLLDILNSNGTYYIVLSGPEHAAGQKALSVINAQAKAAGATRVYHWDPYLDGYQLDSTSASGIGSMAGGSSVQSTGSANINEAWRLVTASLPASASQPGGILYDYKGDTTLLLLVKITDRTDAVNGKAILSSWSLKDSDAAVFDQTSEADAQAVQGVFYPAPAGAFVPNSVRSEYQFFKRAYNGAATFMERGTPAGKDRIGNAVQILSDVDFPSGKGFVLDSIDIKEFYNLANSPGEKVFLFAGVGCPNTQAIIGSIAAEAKRQGTPAVYVVDFALSSNVKFDTGVNIDHVINLTATGGLWIRRSTVPSATLSYPQYGYSYLYGEAVKYLDPGFVTENFSKKNNSIAYYPNGDLTGSVTTQTPWATDLVAGQTPNAKRLQVPFLVRYNKDAAQPVVKRWLHENSANDGTYAEYMLQLAWVRRTTAAIESTETVADGLTRTRFAAEGVAALAPVLKTNSLARATVTVGAQTYTGKPIMPAITVKLGGRTLRSGVDYTVAFANNIAVGRAAVILAGKGGYIGSRTITFAINPKPMSVNRLTAGPRKIIVYWTRLSGTTGYQIAYRRKGAATWRTVSAAASANGLSIRNLARSTTYQVRIRRYKTVSGVSYYSAWSATKTSRVVK